MTVNPTNSADDEMVEIYRSVGGFNIGYAAEILSRSGSRNGHHLPSVALANSNAQIATTSHKGGSDAASPTLPPNQLVLLYSLATAIRNFGYKEADVNPLSPPPKVSALDPASYELSEDVFKFPNKDLAKILTDYPLGMGGDLGQLFSHLKALYCGSIGYEFAHIHSSEEREWLMKQVETNAHRKFLTAEQQRYFINLLTKAETLERFLHKAFPGQRWYSLEGAESVIVLFDHIALQAAASGTRTLLVGMAHRGRINMLAHGFGKPYREIISEFIGGEYTYIASLEARGLMADVKYHMGARRERDYDNDGRPDITMHLMPNPSHLEMVSPVVAGGARAMQDDAPEGDRRRIMGLLIHGDAAFAGQGIVAESLNLCTLPGYDVGGTLHIIINNQIGFTTPQNQSFSGESPSDIARGFDIPVVHVNADDVEACVAAARLAVAYNKRFNKDFVIDLIGYRRFGHNETDDPMITQPRMYKKIANHPTVRDIYAGQLDEKGMVPIAESNAERDALFEELFDLKTELENISSSRPATDFVPEFSSPLHKSTALQEQPPAPLIEELDEINASISHLPSDISPHKSVLRMIKRRETAFAAGGKVDWSHAETLAFGLILRSGISVRLTGQDVQRGTFSQRHAVVLDSDTEKRWVPLEQIRPGRFQVHNSPLSEMAALGFEHGYSVFSRDTLVVWEAQFGDFVNNAQSIVDEMVVSSYTKWGQNSGLVMLLPHGYEGQGPNHSHAYLERFLALAARRNISVVNPTTAAQYFHILRRQARMIKEKVARPLIVMSAKSLLRLPSAASDVADLTNGTFRKVIPYVNEKQYPHKVRNLVLCSGKVFADLASNPAAGIAEDFAVIRFEELFPFPRTELGDAVAKFPAAEEVVWLQEEPRNRGAWGYISAILRETLEGRTIRYVGRPPTSSPAEGSAWLHKIQQDELIEIALGTRPKLGESG